MTLLRAAALLLTLMLVLQTAAAGPTQQQQQQPSSADQLSQLLSPLVESAVTRALSDWRPPALSELGQLRVRLDALEQELRARLEALEQELRATREAGPGTCGACQPLTLATLCQPAGERTPTEAVTTTGRDLTGQEPEPKQEQEPETEPEPVCEEAPTPLPLDAAPHQEPAVRPCARSCLQLRNRGGAPQDGVYWFTGMSVPVLCDFSHDGGGWTLLLTAATKDGWDALAVMSRAERSPSLTANYAILQHADAIRDLGTGGRFAYRIEAQAETGRRRWGGVWLAPRAYSFVHETPSQTDVSIVRRFDIWTYKNDGIEKRLPWLNTGGFNGGILTTSSSATSNWWGTLVSHEGSDTRQHSPWIDSEARHSGIIHYWVREEVV